MKKIMIFALSLTLISCGSLPFYKSKPVNKAPVKTAFIPINRVQTDYPTKAVRQLVEGSCDVEYTVNTEGRTENIKIVQCSPMGVFERSSLKAAKKFRYEPRIENGKAVEVAGVRNTITFEIH